MTNREMLNAMSDVEYAAFLQTVADCCHDDDCDGCPLDTSDTCGILSTIAWLHEEAKQE